MSRLKPTLDRLREQGRKALIPFITAGDPHPRHTPDLMHALVEAGADVVELGVPFSDPMADGPVIQLACERALQAGTTLRKVLEMVRLFRTRDEQTPVVLMGYLNPIERFGIEDFATAARDAGVDGILIVDLAVEEAEAYLTPLRAAGLDSIFLLSPTTADARIAKVAEVASGYLYYVSLKGVTGAATLDVDSVRERIDIIRRHTALPVAVGFGIRDAASARAVGAVSDGVVVGSALVTLIQQHQEAPETLPALLGATLADIRRALDSLS
ncbi:tryptophan synthase subunit alpha [Flagellatimonas centrodinii]|uniref:tryptophan synthase subunit alpha n=1 Tax=Flagellatimonas centrodinii TaxID=2806210 RepID=UPI001FFB789F|nr:tryptophan synthase subunit alpha [Flagellatimonas centrodinii]ULQ46368.1 tryptophan synthase subunit alpha [Flagellatimonas centrodinii]